MKKWGIMILLSSTLFFVACQSSEVEITPKPESTKEIQTTVQDKNIEDDKKDVEVEEDLEWMEEKNKDAITNYGLLNTRDGDLLGPTISYSLMEGDNEFESKPELYVSFDGDRYKIDLGWFPPNMHGINITTLNERELHNSTFEFPEYELFNDFIESDEYTHLFNDDTLWQITAADITGNGVLELILLAYYWDYEIGSVNKAVSVYEYTKDKEVPFELAVHFKGMNMTSRTDQTMYFTEDLEFVHDSYREDKVEAFYEDGEWYIPEES